MNNFKPEGNKQGVTENPQNSYQQGGSQAPSEIFAKPNYNNPESNIKILNDLEVKMPKINTKITELETKLQNGNELEPNQRKKLEKELAFYKNSYEVFDKTLKGVAAKTKEMKSKSLEESVYREPRMLSKKTTINSKSPNSTYREPRMNPFLTENTNSNENNNSDEAIIQSVLDFKIPKGQAGDAQRAQADARAHFQEWKKENPEPVTTTENPKHVQNKIIIDNFTNMIKEDPSRRGIINAGKYIVQNLHSPKTLKEINDFLLKHGINIEDIMNREKEERVKEINQRD